jgi:hypothetical protein
VGTIAMKDETNTIKIPTADTYLLKKRLQNKFLRLSEILGGLFFALYFHRTGLSLYELL